MERVSELVGLFSTLIHLTSGQPARAEEIGSILLINTSDGTGRSFYFVHGTIMLLQVYHKGRNYLNHEKRIARFLPTALTELLLKYLLFVRPVERFFAGMLYDGSDAVSLYGTHLLVSKGRVCNGEFVCNAFKAHSLMEMGIPLGIADYRHVAIAFIDKHVRRQPDETEHSGDGDGNGNGEAQDDIIDIQAGHSSATAAMYYARSNLDHRWLSRNAMQMFYRCSRKWQSMLSLEPGASASTHEIPMTGTLMHQSHHMDTASLTAPAPCPLPHLSNYHWPRPRPVIDGASGPAAAAAAAAAKDTHISAMDSFNMLRQLGQFYHDKGETPSSFKSPHQAMALQVICARERDVLVVLPTGGGKSLLFMLPAFMETGRTTVVVVPLVALTSDTQMRCTQAGLSCAAWKSGEDVAVLASTECPRLLLVSVEIAGTVRFIGFLLNLLAQGRLARIVVDECHLAVTWSSFRPRMRDLVGLRRVAVPLVLLTASLPPSMEGQLSIAFSSDFVTVRASTVRPEVAYRVVLARDGDGEQYHHHDHVGLRVVQIVKQLADRYLDASETARGIVYCRTRRETEVLCERLNATRQSVAATYHAGMTDKDKKASFGSWHSGRVRVMVVTKAFGMGIDYGAVRFVVHSGVPETLLDYAQESGRCGRDGRRAEAVVVWSAGRDLFNVRKRLRDGEEGEEGHDGEEREEGHDGEEREEGHDGEEREEGHDGEEGEEGHDGEEREEGHDGEEGEEGHDGEEGGDKYDDEHGHGGDKRRKAAVEESMVKWAQNTSVCRRAMLQRAVDGNGDGSHCAYSSHFAQCDVCEQSQMGMTVDGGAVQAVPAQAVPVQAQVQAAQGAEARHNAQTARRLHMAQALGDVRGRCVVCVLRGEPADTHAISRCKYLAGRCLKCQGRGHGARMCPNKTKFAAGSRVCYGCGVGEDSAEGRMLHVDGTGAECAWRDVVVPVCWYMWRHERTQLASYAGLGEIRDMPTDAAFGQWLARMHDGVSRCVDVFCRRMG
jgi:superfamily II DNA/RNA helicase